jgi:hypothetical protein
MGCPYCIKAHAGVCGRGDIQARIEALHLELAAIKAIATKLDTFDIEHNWEGAK